MSLSDLSRSQQNLSLSDLLIKSPNPSSNQIAQVSSQKLSLKDLLKQSSASTDMKSSIVKNDSSHTLGKISSIRNVSSNILKESSSGSSDSTFTSVESPSTSLDPSISPASFLKELLNRTDAVKAQGKKILANQNVAVSDEIRANPPASSLLAKFLTESSAPEIHVKKPESQLNNFKISNLVINLKSTARQKLYTQPSMFAIALCQKNALLKSFEQDECGVDFSNPLGCNGIDNISRFTFRNQSPDDIVHEKQKLAFGVKDAAKTGIMFCHAFLFNLHYSII